MAHTQKHKEAISRGLKDFHKGKTRKYSKSQKRALDKSKTSKSGHKTWRQRQTEKKPGLWSNYWKKKHANR